MLFAPLLVTLVLAQQAPGVLPSVPERAPEASVVRVEGLFPGGQNHQGSGVVVAPGVLATNAHVVAGATLITIRKGLETWTVRDYCVEPDLDLCLLRIPGLALPVARLGTEVELTPGQPVVAIGYPAGQGLRTRAGTLVSTWHFRGDHLLQSDAPIQHGSSGGGLFSADGKLLGITTFMLADAGQANFSVPIAWVQALLDGAPGAGRLVCPGTAKEDVLRSFVDAMTEDPENRASWEALARAWVRDAPDLADAWYAQGIALMLKSAGAGAQSVQVREASAAAFRRAVALRADFPKAWRNLGVALDSLNEFKGAEEALGEAIRLDPDYPSAHLALAGVLMNEGRHREAAAALERGLALQPDDAEGWARLAFCEAALGRWAGAARHYRVALGLSPFHAVWAAELCLACRKAGDPEGAARAMDRLRNLDPALAKSLAVQAP